ncbi:hypothetical protein BaRGS_00006884 [Batillaria attramentaria]|uniref:Uncharacterized protein n=1 Tax=Batillaria attramentaria TaxID=370345 RepID=A0ABD0LRX0_9CAEN
MDCVKDAEQYEFFSAFLNSQRKGNVRQLQFCRAVYAANQMGKGPRRKRLLELIHKTFLLDGGKKLQCLDDSLVEKMSGKSAVDLAEATEVQEVVLAHLGLKWFHRYLDGWPTEQELMDARAHPNESWLATYRRHYSCAVGEEPDDWEDESGDKALEETTWSEEKSPAGDLPTRAADQPPPEPVRRKKSSVDLGKSQLMVMVEQAQKKKTKKSPMAMTLARLVQAASDEMQSRNYQWVDSTSYFMGKFKPKQRRNAISVPALEEDERQMWDLGGVQVEKQLGTDFVESKVPAKKTRTKMTLVKGSKKEKSLRTAEDHWRLRKALRSVLTVLRKIRDFASSLQDPTEYRLFHEYLRRETYQSELKRDAYTTVDWSAHPVYFRKLWTKPASSPGAKPIPITINKLTADLRFWVEVYKYKQEMVALCKGSTVGLRYEPIAQQRALTIARCYLESDIPPKLQINITEELSNSIMESLKRRGPSADLFYVAFMRLTPILFHFWKSFKAEWLTLLEELTGPLAGPRGNRPGKYLDYLDLIPPPIIVERRADIRNQAACGVEHDGMEGYKFTLFTGLRRREGETEKGNEAVINIPFGALLRSLLCVLGGATCLRYNIQRKKTPFVFIHQEATEQNEGPKTKDGKSEAGGKASKARAIVIRVSGTGTESRKSPAVLAALVLKKPVSLMKIM